MKLSSLTKPLAMAGILAMVAAPAVADQVLLRVIASNSTAQAGQSGISSHNRAVAEILALNHDLKPINNLSPAGWTGNGTAVVTIPGWSIDTLLVGAGGCVLKPIALRNNGNGVYALQLTTESVNGPCEWKTGDYIFSVEVNTKSHHAIGLGTFEIE